MSGEANSSSLIQSRPHRNGKKKLAPDRSNVSPIHHKVATQALKNNHLERRERVGSDLPEDEEATILAAFDQHFASMSATSTTHFSDWHEIHVHSDGDRLAYVNAVTREARWQKPKGWVKMMTKSLKKAKQKSKVDKSKGVLVDQLLIGYETENPIHSAFTSQR